MTITKKRTMAEGKMLELVHYKNGRNFDDGGFVFPANADGTPRLEEMAPAAKANYDRLVENGALLELEEITYAYTRPAEGVCGCGEYICLEGDTQCQKCGQWYNAFGQRLVPPSQWED